MNYFDSWKEIMEITGDIEKLSKNYEKTPQFKYVKVWILHKLWDQMSEVKFYLILPLTSCVILDKLLNFSVALLLIYKIGIIVVPNS